MTWWYALVFGALQGATEFLPVSSSGHLAAAKWLLGVDAASSLAFDILLHVATLVAVVGYYRTEVVSLVRSIPLCVRAAWRGDRAVFGEDPWARTALLLLVATVPTAVIGVLGDALGVVVAVESRPVWLGMSFLVCGAVLLSTVRSPGGGGPMTWRTALVVGVVQGIAVLPGISRSGVTIAAALLAGVDRSEAVRFSFLASIPAIVGAAVVETGPALWQGGIPVLPAILGALAAFVVGWVCLAFLVGLVRKDRLWLFAPYVLVLGTTLFLVG